FEHGTTRIGPILDTPPKESAHLSALLNEAMLPAKVKAKLVTWLQPIMAVGMPFLSALAPAQYEMDTALTDPSLRRLIVDAQNDALAVLRAGGEPLGAMGHALTFMPRTLLAAAYRL